MADFGTAVQLPPSTATSREALSNCWKSQRCQKESRALDDPGGTAIPVAPSGWAKAETNLWAGSRQDGPPKRKIRSPLCPAQLWIPRHSAKPLEELPSVPTVQSDRPLPDSKSLV